MHTQDLLGLKIVILTLLVCTGILSCLTKQSYADVRITNDGTTEVGTIEITGTISKGDALAFKRSVESISQTTKNKINGVPFIMVDLNSPGGNAMEAVEIGRFIRSRFLFTRAVKQRCNSACVLILISGVMRSVSSSVQIGLHRPHFDSDYFANLTAEQARNKYNDIVEKLRSYFVEMGGDETAFRIMMRTPSDKVYSVNDREMDFFGFRGGDPAWDEHSEAGMIKQYGKRRWPFMKQCLEGQPNDFYKCQRRAIELYPND